MVLNIKIMMYWVLFWRSVLLPSSGYLEHGSSRLIPNRFVPIHQTVRHTSKDVVILNSHEIWYLRIFLNFVDSFQFWLKSTITTTDNLHEDMHAENYFRQNLERKRKDICVQHMSISIRVLEIIIERNGMKMPGLIHFQSCYIYIFVFNIKIISNIMFT